MKRTIMFCGQGGRPSLELNMWLNKHTEAVLETAQIQIQEDKDSTLLLAVVDVPTGTKIYKYEEEREDNEND